MFPEVHLNLDKLAFEHLYQLLLMPFIPGSVLVGGLVLVRPDLITSVPFAAGISPYVRLVVGIVAAYIVGWILYAVAILIMGLLFGLVLLALRKRSLVRNNHAQSHGPIWQKVVRQFLGPELAPSPSPAPLPVAQMPAEKVAAAIARNFDSAVQSHAEWQEWYDVLQDYVLRDVPVVNEGSMLFFVTVQATGWALAWLSIAGARARHWEFYAIELLFILLSGFAYGASFLGYLTRDRLPYWRYTALLLAEVRKTATKTNSETAGNSKS